MKILLLLALSLNTAPACVLAPELPQNPQHAQAVEATFHRGLGDDLIDADPVQARAASWSPVVRVVDAFPWQDRLVELVPAAVNGPVQPAAQTPALSGDLVDGDPLAARGWR